MKPGRRDIPVKVKITEATLTELKEHTWRMSEAFGLDAKIDAYKGIRPISFYRWDLDCLLDVLFTALGDEKEYPDKKSEGYARLHELYLDLKKKYEQTYG